MLLKISLFETERGHTLGPGPKVLSRKRKPRKNAQNLAFSGGYFEWLKAYARGVSPGGAPPPGALSGSPWGVEPGTPGDPGGPWGALGTPGGPRVPQGAPGCPRGPRGPFEAPEGPQGAAGVPGAGPQRVPPLSLEKIYLEEQQPAALFSMGGRRPP